MWKYHARHYKSLQTALREENRKKRKFKTIQVATSVEIQIL